MPNYRFDQLNRIKERLNEKKSTRNLLKLGWILLRLYLAIEIVILYIFLVNYFTAGEGFLSLHSDLWEIILRTSTLNKIIIFSLPIIITAIGAAFNERSGVINIGLEGIMLFGAFAAAFFSYQTGNPWMGVLGAVLFGGLVGLMHGIVTIKYKGEQIVAGVAINFLAIGMTTIFARLIWEKENVTEFDGFDNVKIYEFPIIGPVLGLFNFEANGWDIPDPIAALNNESPLVFIAILLIPICHIILFRSTLGLRIQVIGEHPQAAATAGISVYRYQYFAVIFSAMLGGFGGAMLSLDTSSFDPDMIGGKGFYALAVMIFGKWTIIGTALGGVFFGFFNVLTIPLSIAKPDIPKEFVQMLPNILAMLALAGYVGRARPPKNIGKAYDPAEGS